MRASGLVSALLVAFSSEVAAHPHRYLDQQAQISVGTNTVDLAIRIVPSSEEGAEIFAHIDRDGSGGVSDAEAAAFGADVVSKAVLEVDGEKVAFRTVTATVPSKEQVSAGSGVIEVKAAAFFTLAGTKDHQVAFDIAYDEFSHDWFVQPFFYPDLTDAASLPLVERTDAGHRVGILFSSTRDEPVIRFPRRVR